MTREKVVGEHKHLEESRFSEAMDDEAKCNNRSSSDKKPRFRWSPELHSKFEEVYRTLLEQKLHARPRDILKLMNVPNLTTTQISSHLQKYHARQLRIRECGATNSPFVSKSSDPHGKSEITRQIKDQSFPPSVLARQSSSLGSKGLYGGLECDPRTTNQYYQHLGLATNPTSYFSLHTNEIQTKPSGYLQTSSQKYQAQQLCTKESGATNSPPVSKSYDPHGKTEIAQQIEDHNFLPSVLACQTSGLESKGLYDGLEYDPRTTNQYYQYLGLATNSTSYFPPHINEVQTKPCGYLQMLSQVKEKNEFPYNPNKIATFGLELSITQVLEMTLPSLSCQATASSTTLKTNKKYQAQQLCIKESGANNSPLVSKSFDPYGKTEIARQIKDHNFLPSVLAHQTSGLGSKGLCDGLEYDTRTTNQYYQHLGLATNPTSYFSPDINEVQTKPCGYLQTSSQVNEKNGFPYNPNKIATSSTALETMDQFPVVTATLSQELDFTRDQPFYVRSEIQNQFPLGSSDSLHLQAEAGLTSPTYESLHPQAEAGLTSPACLGDSTFESLHQQAGAGLTSPTCSLIQNQYEDEYAELLRMLEEDPQEDNEEMTPKIDGNLD